MVGMGWFVVFSSPLFIVGVLLSGFVYSMQAGAATSDSAAVEVGERFASDWLGPILMFSAAMAILGSCGRLLYGTRTTVASEAQLATGEAPRKIATDIAFGKFAGFFVGGVTMAIWFYVLLIGPVKWRHRCRPVLYLMGRYSCLPHMESIERKAERAL